MVDKPQWSETRHSELLQRRKKALLPPVAQNLIKDQFLGTFSPTGERGIYKPYNTLRNLQIVMYLNYGKSNMQSVLEILPKRIENAVRKGRTFRILDVGCDSFASLFTGLSSSSGLGTNLETVKRTIEKVDTGLQEVIKSWGFEAGKHYEMIGIHGGHFAIPQRKGLKLISTDMFDNIPLPAESIDMLTSFSTVYQNYGGFYLLEVFDRLLKRSSSRSETGMAVVWPFKGSYLGMELVDQQGRLLDFNTVFENLNTPLHFLNEANHISWTAKANSELTFPLRPIALARKKRSYENLIYQVDTAFLQSNVGQRIILDDRRRSLNAVLAHADQVEYF